MIYVCVDGRRMEYVRKYLNAKNVLDRQKFSEGDILVLPLRWKKCLEDKKINVSNLKNILIFSPYNHEQLKQNNKLFCYMEDCGILNLNAKLTALGILNILSDKGISFFDLNVDIIGHGYCAKEIAKLFDYLNIKYRFIYYKKIENGILNSEYKKKGNMIINTAPICILNENDINLYNVDYILDISSEKCMKKLQGKIASQIIFPGSLPELYYSSDAAYLIANFVWRNLYER